MKILVLGSAGQIGHHLLRSLLPLGEVVGFDRAQADLSDTEGLLHAVRAVAPSLIVNAAAYTAVDHAESEPDTACAINATAPGQLAMLARSLNALLVHYSTDYVFEGTTERPYLETDAPRPINAYGRSKLAGEQAVQAAAGDSLILRTSWVYDARGHNFLNTILRLAESRETFSVVSDQMGAPTWSRWIADATAHIVRAALARRAAGEFRSGLYHLTCAGATSWHGFAGAILEQARALRPQRPLRVRDIVPIATEAYPLPAPRPRNSRLDCSLVEREYGIHRPEWRQALGLCMAELAAEL